MTFLCTVSNIEQTIKTRFGKLTRIIMSGATQIIQAGSSVKELLVVIRRPRQVLQALKSSCQNPRGTSEFV